MTIRRILPSHLFFLLLLVTASCEKFSGDQTIPSYLNIQSISITTDYPNQGTASSIITDAWVYVDDDFLGAYELPCRVPVLKTGKHQVTVLPGIKKNGIASTRTNYSFYNSIVKSVNLIQDSIVSLGSLVSTYQSTTLFPFREDFEGLSIGFDTTQRSTTNILLTAPGSPETFEREHSGKVVLDDTAHSFFECQTHNEYPIPTTAPVYLEMNFNTTNSITVGIITYSYSSLYQIPVLTLNPTNGAWKKIYIDLSTSMWAYQGVSTFRVYLGTFIDSGKTESTILFDNFKILYR